MGEPLPAELEAVAQAIVERRLTVPAVFFLELHRPLAGLAGQAAVLGTPLLAPLLGLDRFRTLQRVLADPAQFNAFLDRLEALDRRGEEA